MIKPTNKTCNKEVQKFTNTSYDILLELYNNTDFFKELWETLSPGYIWDFSYGSGDWKSVEGTGFLQTETGYVKSFGGNIYNDQLSIDADENKIFTFIFESENAGEIASVQITYSDGRTVEYLDVFTYVNGTNGSLINLQDKESHFGLMTGLLIVFTSNLNKVFNLFKFSFGKPITLISSVNLTRIESKITSTRQRVAVIENNLISLNSRIDSLEETPALTLNPNSLDENSIKYEITGLKKEDVTKKVLFKDDVVELINSRGNSYFKYNISEGFYEYKGIIVLADGTVITGMEDIRALDGQNGFDGDYQEFRFARSVDTPPIDKNNPIPSNFFVNPPEGDLPLWLVISKKRSNGILISNWSNPVKISGKSGDSGESGSDGFSRATVYAYKAGESINASDTPGDSLYTFSTGVVVLSNGWSSNIPNTNLPVWVRTGSVISKNSTSIISSNEWSEAVKITSSSLNSAQLFIYKRSSSSTPPAANDKPTLNATYNFETGILSGLNNGWTNVPPLSSGKYLWVRAAVVASSTLTDDILPSDWSEPRLLASDGSDGSSFTGETYSGAERKGATYSNLSWSNTGADSANARWGTLTGRSPVAGDVFIQVNSTTGTTEVRAYNGTVWANPATVYESLVTFGVLSGEQIIAGSVINAPVIRGGSLELTGNSASTFITIIRNDPFGPNNLVEWFGPKIEGVTWNTATNSPIYSGMRMTNAKTYKTMNGDVYFGGTFRAGVASNSLQTTLITPNPVQVMSFSSNGGLIEIAASLSYMDNEPNYTETVCPAPLPAAPTATIFIEQLVGSDWLVRSQKTFNGVVSCIDGSSGAGEPRSISRSLGGTITVTDSDGVANNRTYRARAAITNYTATVNTYQSLSITSSEG